MSLGKGVEHERAFHDVKVRFLTSCSKTLHHRSKQAAVGTLQTQLDIFFFRKLTFSSITAVIFCLSLCG